MNDDTDFDFDIGPTTSVPEAAPIPTTGAQPAAGQSVPTHHFRTPSGTVTVAAHDAMAALIAALADAHRDAQG